MILKNGSSNQPERRTSMSLINREALLSYADLWASCGEHYTAEDVIMMIKTAPTVDAVPVVRCWECKFRDGTPGQPNIQCGNMHDDDFCSYGERKEGADNG